MTLDLSRDVREARELKPEELKLEVKHHWVFVQPIHVDQTEGGIYLPKTVYDRAGNPKQVVQPPAKRGRVLGCGPGMWTNEGTAQIPMSCKVGDIVLYVDQVCEVKGPEHIMLDVIEDSAILSVDT